mmetsp:Transcript_6118/g.28083  ORF Transcript_6118/g.28083 Transcript_6118/m.28083 type:complete len:379 (+) Transcript_6118:1046-2182(+)
MRVKGVDAFAHGGGVREGGQRREHRLHRDDVGEGDGHAAARQRVSHVERVAEEHRAGRPRRLRRHCLVHHRLERAALHRLDERVPELLRDLRDDLGEDVLRHRAGRDARHLHVRGNVHQTSNLLARYRVEQHGRGVAEDDVPVPGPREELVRVTVDDDPDERARGHRRRRRRELLAEARKVPVAHHRERREILLLLRLVFRRRDAADGHALAVDPLLPVHVQELLDRRLANRHLLAPERRLAKSHDEAAVVKRSPRDVVSASLERVPDERLAAVLVHGVAVHLLRVDVVDAVVQAELFELEVAAGLEEFADDAHGLGEVALEEEDVAALVAEGVGEGRARDAGAHDDDVPLRRGTGRVSLAAATHRSPAEVNPRTLGL